MKPKFKILRLRSANYPTENPSVFGYMRFSYLGQSDARLSRLVKGQQKFDLLYDADRMEQRFYVFENITLPSLKAQLCTDFRMHILLSNTMPEVYKRRLHALVSNVPQIELVFSNAPTANDAFALLVQKNVADTSERTVHFRMDDDDALSNQTIHQLKKSIRYAPDNALITTPRGMLLMKRNNEVHLMRKFEQHIAIGWALVNRPGQVRNPYQFRHRNYYERVPSVTLPHFSSYIHSCYESCDTQPAQDRKLLAAQNMDKNHATARGIEDISAAIEKDFPWTNRNKLIQIFADMPPGRKTAIWMEDGFDIVPDTAQVA
ncbi:MAG: glycosyltransferase [Planktomarina sp.]